MTTWSLHFDGENLARATARLPGGAAIGLTTRAAEHPLLGVCDVITDAHDRVLARLAAVDWARPRSIPALDVPGALPAGAGTCVLNLLAEQARDVGIASLRYRGPYPTAALFGTLRSSFAVVGDRELARERFTADVEHAAFTGTAIEPAVHFVPDPHVWTWPSPRVCAQHRHGLERAWIDGRPWDRDGEGPRRLRRRDDGWSACFEIDGIALAEVAVLDDAGRPSADPLMRIPVNDALVGAPLPEAAREVLASVLEHDAVEALRPAVAAVMGEHVLELGDSGFELARIDPGRIVLHTGLAERSAEIAPAHSLALLAAALRPVVLRAAQRRLAAAHAL